MQHNHKEEKVSNYADRIKEVVDDERKKAAFKQPEQHYNMTDKEKSYALALLNLRENPDFKIFMKMEADLIGQRLADAFSLPSQEMLATDDYACKMAFNHGRYYQMRYVMNSRNMLQKLYVEMTNKEGTDGEDKESK